MQTQAKRVAAQPQADQVEDVLLEAAATKDHADVQKLGPNASVCADAPDDFLNVCPLASHSIEMVFIEPILCVCIAFAVSLLSSALQRLEHLQQ